MQILDRALVTTLVFLTLPLGLLLWMRRSILRLGRADPTAAWFGYFRALNWAVTGGMILWTTSGLGARQIFQAWLMYAGLPIWKSAICDVLAAIGPAFTLYLLCVLISYPVYVQLKGTNWTRREYLSQQLAAVGAQALPVMFLLAAIGSIGREPRTSAILFISAFISWAICHRLLLRTTKAYPHALTTGELRDRIFDLAGRVGVASQIFVIPSGKLQIANAYAANNRIVMFTDYLLEHLTKREVARSEAARRRWSAPWTAGGWTG